MKYDASSLLAFCQSDRDQLLAAWWARRRRARRPRVPAEMLDELLRDEMGFSVVRLALPGNLLGYCDYHARRIIVRIDVESLCKPNTYIQGVVHSTMAHEMAHIRFPHHRLELQGELAARLADGCCDDWDLPDPDSATERDREYQAEYYATVFLVPEDQLFARAEAQEIEAAWREGRAIDSDTMWDMLERMGHHFLVTRGLMARRLKRLGWLRRDEKNVQRLLICGTEN